MVSVLDSEASGPGSSPGRGHCVVSLGNTLLITLRVPLSSQVYKWVPANCWGNLTKLRGVTWNAPASRPGEVEILLAAACYRNSGISSGNYGPGLALGLLSLFLHAIAVHCQSK